MINRPFGLAGHSLLLSTSVGIVIFPHDNADEKTLIKYADTAMYQAKDEGGSRYALYQPEMQQEAWF